MALTLDGTTGISATGNIYGNNMIVANALVVGSFSPAVISVSGNITGGNLITGGLISATGNITSVGNVAGNYILGNGALLTGVITSVANINSGTSNVTVVSSGGNVSVGVGGTSNVAVFATTGEYITGVVSASGNITGGNVLTGGIISATGNITGNYLLGNGSQLTGIDATSIQNGTSNVKVVSSGGNVSVGVGGTSNVVVWATTGEYVTGLISASGNITGGNLTVSTGNITGGNAIIGNAGGFGDVTTTQFAGIFAKANGLNATSLVQVKGNDGINGMGMRAVTGSNGLIYSNSSIDLRVGSTIRDLDTPTGGNIIATIASTGLTVNGIVSASGNVTGGNVLTGGLVSASGTVTGSSLLGSVVSATGNVTGANVNTSTLQPLSGALTIGTVAGNLNLQPTTGNIVVNNTYINGVTNPVQDQDAATKIYVDNAVSTSISYHAPATAATTTDLATATGGVITYTQPNGAANGVGALLTTTGSFNLIDTANVQTIGTRILVKNEANAVLNGVYTWANATNIVRSTDTNTYGAGNVLAIGLNDYFFVTSGNVNAGSAYIVSAPTGTITFGTSNITFSQFSSSQTYTANTSAGVSLVGTVITAKVDGTTTAFDGSGNISVKASATLTTPNIGAATGTSLSATGNVQGGNILTGGLISATGAIQVGGDLSLVGNIVDTGPLTVSTSSNGNITLSPNGTGVIIITKDIINGQANSVGNIGSSTAYFNTLFAKATSAQYADLAELYVADATYAPGTVLDFGGAKEVTLSSVASSARIAGVVSTNPAHLMNSMIQDDSTVPVALQGRVPTSVTGTVRKGDMMVSAGNGFAQACATPSMGTVIGKALADFDGVSGTIEIVVGRL